MREETEENVDFWNDDDKGKLIEDVRAHECIWDQRKLQHREKSVDKAWKEISEHLGHPRECSFLNPLPRANRAKRGL